MFSRQVSFLTNVACVCPIYPHGVFMVSFYFDWKPYGVRGLPCDRHLYLKASKRPTLPWCDRRTRHTIDHLRAHFHGTKQANYERDDTLSTDSHANAHAILAISEQTHRDAPPPPSLPSLHPSSERHCIYIYLLPVNELFR